MCPRCGDTKDRTFRDRKQSDTVGFFGPRLNYVYSGPQLGIGRTKGHHTYT